MRYEMVDDESLEYYILHTIEIGFDSIADIIIYLKHWQDAGIIKEDFSYHQIDTLIKKLELDGKIKKNLPVSVTWRIAS
jgi:hypothetical protein